MAAFFIHGRSESRIYVGCFSATEMQQDTQNNVLLRALSREMLELKEKYQTDAVVFGDIDLEPHREWEEKVCKSANLEAILPLWQQNRKELQF